MEEAPPPKKKDDDEFDDFQEADTPEPILPTPEEILAKKEED
jgi:hypothetical protein